MLAIPLSIPPPPPEEDRTDAPPQIASVRLADPFDTPNLPPSLRLMALSSLQNLGFAVEELGGGLTVAGVYSASLVDGQLTRGDRITAVNGARVNTIAELMSAVGSVIEKTDRSTVVVPPIRLTFVRDDAEYRTVWRKAWSRRLWQSFRYRTEADDALKYAWFQTFGLDVSQIADFALAFPKHPRAPELTNLALSLGRWRVLVTDRDVSRDYANALHQMGVLLYGMSGPGISKLSYATQVHWGMMDYQNRIHNGKIDRLNLHISDLDTLTDDQIIAIADWYRTGNTRDDPMFHLAACMTQKEGVARSTFAAADKLLHEAERAGAKKGENLRGAVMFLQKKNKMNPTGIPDCDFVEKILRKARR